jgi:UDP-N-acetylmuramoyl-tripeptide--D-alanyl-D-alanine ligase
MKQILRNIVLFLLRLMAKRRMRKFKGKVVVITGSVGKTSTREAVFKVLNSKYRVKRSPKNMNSDFGLLLTILDLKSGFSSAAKWSWYLTKGFFNSFSPEKSEILLLELGVDKPGDMDFLTSIVTADYAIITSVAPVHLGEGQFSNLQEIFEEKTKIVNSLKAEGKVLLNIDNGHLADFHSSYEGHTKISYGFHENADYQMADCQTSLSGTSFDLQWKEEEKHNFSANVLGSFQSYVLTPAVIIGLEFGFTIQEINDAFKRFSLPPGRMTVIDGLKDSTILDSTYNSSPVSLKAAVKLLGELGQDAKRRVAVIGNMNELGDESELKHSLIGKMIGDYCDFLITVGKDAKTIAKTALENGFDEENVHSFTYAKEASAFFKKKIKKGDLILVKGSQNRVRLERFVKEIMQDPNEAKDLLVRQDKTWKAKDI